MDVVQAIGGIMPCLLETGLAEEARLIGCSREGDLDTTVRVGGVDSRSTVTLLLEASQDLRGDYFYFQSVSRCVSLTGERMTKIATSRLPVVGPIKEWMASMDPTVLSQVIARRSVMLARSSPESGLSSDILQELDTQLYNLGSNFGIPGGSKRGEALRRLEGPEARLPGSIYALRRGPLLGGGMGGNADEVDALRCTFLQSTIEEGEALLAPKLFKVEQGGRLASVPPQTLALQSGWVLLMDVHSHVLIWSGKDVAGEDWGGYREAAMAVALERSRGRYPSPPVLSFGEASSQARYLIARLTPAHKDFPEEQCESFPQLAELAPAALKALQDKLMFTDDPSYREYLASQGIAA